MSKGNQSSKFAQPVVAGDTKKGSMRLEPQVLLKHQHGVTMQWWNVAENYLVVATYQPTQSGNYALSNLAGPWSGVEKPNEADPKSWKPCILPGYESERADALETADIVLMCLNAGQAGEQALPAAFHGPIMGFEALSAN